MQNVIAYKHEIVDVQTPFWFAVSDIFENRVPFRPHEVQNRLFPSARVSVLDTQNFDHVTLERNGLQYWQLHAFHVQAEVVDGRYVERSHDGCEREAGHLDDVTVRLLAHLRCLAAVLERQVVCAAHRYPQPRRPALCAQA